MTIETQERYMNILKKQITQGLDILETMSVEDEKYQQVVVNINNASNISFQLETEIENQKKEKTDISQLDTTEKKIDKKRK